MSDWHIAGGRFPHPATPPTNLMVLRDLMDQTSIYELIVDTRMDQPAHAMLTDIAQGEWMWAAVGSLSRVLHSA